MSEAVIKFVESLRKDFLSKSSFAELWSTTSRKNTSPIFFRRRRLAPSGCETRAKSTRKTKRTNSNWFANTIGIAKIKQWPASKRIISWRCATIWSFTTNWRRGEASSPFRLGPTSLIIEFDWANDERLLVESNPGIFDWFNVIDPFPTPKRELRWERPKLQLGTFPFFAEETVESVE